MSIDIEKLEELNSLKEKGIITEEEFNEHKQKLLSKDDDKSNSSKGFSWRNLGVSFLGAVLYMILAFYIDSIIPGSYKILNIIAAIFFAVIALKMNIKYSCLLIFFVIIWWGPIGIWAAVYQFLQIRDKNVELVK